MKMRRVIGECRVIRERQGLSEKTIVPLCFDATWNDYLQKVEVGEKVELAVYEDVLPKRALITPENLVIIQVDTYSFICIADKNLGKSIGKFAMDGHWEVRDSFGIHRGLALTESSAKQAAFECLADLNWHGFSWITPSTSRTAQKRGA
jgi:hypothetical protein